MTNQALKIVKGRVIRGEGIGHRQGYPTANLDRRYFRMHPVADGVYAGMVGIRKKQRQCVVIIGAPFLAARKKTRKIEIYILNFRGDIRNRLLEARIVKKIRPMKKFANQQDLLRQIRHDVKQAKTILHHYIQKHV